MTWKREAEYSAKALNGETFIDLDFPLLFIDRVDFDSVCEDCDAFLCDGTGSNCKALLAELKASHERVEALRALLRRAYAYDLAGGDAEIEAELA